MIKKSHKKYSKFLTRTKHTLKFGNYGLKLIYPIMLTQKQLFMLETLVWKFLKKVDIFSNNLKFWNLISTNIFLTKLSLESRMGKGKGTIYTEAVFLKGGTIIFEFKNIKKSSLQELLLFLKKRMPLTKLVLVSFK